MKKSVENCSYSKFDLGYGEWKCRFWSRRLLKPEECAFCMEWKKASKEELEKKEKDKEYEDE